MKSYDGMLFRIGLPVQKYGSARFHKIEKPKFNTPPWFSSHFQKKLSYVYVQSFVGVGLADIISGSGNYSIE